METGWQDLCEELQGRILNRLPDDKERSDLTMFPAKFICASESESMKAVNTWNRLELASQILPSK
jgi:hypothetical protein